MKANSILPDGDDDDPEVSQEVEETTHLLEVFTDGDWASCHGTRRSTSCAVLALNGSVVYSYSRRQKVVSLSSGEAEYYAAASGASEGVYLKNIVQFLTGKPVRLVLRCDSQAARDTATRSPRKTNTHLFESSVVARSLPVRYFVNYCSSNKIQLG